MQELDYTQGFAFVYPDKTIQFIALPMKQEQALMVPTKDEEVPEFISGEEE